MGKVADGGNLRLTGTGLGRDSITDKGGTQGHIPPPGLHSVDGETAQLRLVDKTLRRPSYPRPEPAVCPSGLLHMLHQHTVVIASPECRQIAEVSPQPTARMRRSEIAQARGQGKVMFGVEDMESHFQYITDSGTKIVIIWHE